MRSDSWPNWSLSWSGGLQPAAREPRLGSHAYMVTRFSTSRFLLQVFKPIVEKFGVHFDCDIRLRGYYPKGGGEVMVTVNPVKELQPVTMTERGTITKIHGRAFVAGVLPFKLAKDMSAAAVRTIRKEIKELYINIQPVQEKDKAYGNGNGIIIIAESSTGCLFAGSALGKKGEDVGRPAGGSTC
ncbi:RNA 3'-terminal phosphate cyclase-like [Anableps anableps]